MKCLLDCVAGVSKNLRQRNETGREYEQIKPCAKETKQGGCANKDKWEGESFTGIPPKSNVVGLAKTN